MSDLVWRHYEPLAPLFQSRSQPHCDLLKLVFAHGYGCADGCDDQDPTNDQPVQPESLFRIASVSKPITSATILKLMEEGKLDLDAKVFCELGGGCLLEHIQPPPGGFVVDQRLYDITVRHLLTHSGGWDQNGTDWHSNEVNRAAARAFGVTPPATGPQVIGYMMQFSLNFTPGTRFSYANIGYNILGRVIEKVTGQSYEEFVKSQVLAPVGVTRMRSGKTRLEDRAPGEVRYYDYPGAPLVPSVFPPHDLVPAPYGGRCFEVSPSSGGWIASAIDLVRFLTAVDGRRPPALLKPETVNLMLSRPAISTWANTAHYYGMGWWFRPDTGNWWHEGGLAGTATKLGHDGESPQKLGWAGLFNSRPRNRDAFITELSRAYWQAVKEVTEWPTHDLFGQYP